MKKSILIVDDNEKVRSFLLDFFATRPTKFDVHGAKDGLDAVEKAPNIKPDLIVLDLSMPRLDGLAAARRLREMEIRVPIILFTSHADMVPVMEISVKGVNAVVMKPDLTTLNKHVEFFLNRQIPIGDAHVL